MMGGGNRRGNVTACRNIISTKYIRIRNSYYPITIHKTVFYSSNAVHQFHRLPITNFSFPGHHISDSGHIDHKSAQVVISATLLFIYNKQVLSGKRGHWEYQHVGNVEHGQTSISDSVSGFIKQVNTISKEL